MDETQGERTLGEELLLGYPGDSSKEEFDITHEELNQIKDAMKDEKFRKLLSDYVEDVRDPANQLTYQTEMRQLEKERGNIVHFINPIPGFVLKTSVDGKKKAFINVCSNPLIRRPTFETASQNNKTGTLWSIPYSQSAGKDDMDKARKGCTVYDVIFHPETLRMSKQNKVLQKKLEETALEAVEKSFAVVLDKNNVRRPKLRYKGMKIASTIKYPIGGSPPECIDPNELEKELPPQPDEVHNFTTKDDETNKTSKKRDARVESNNMRNVGDNKGSGDAASAKPTDPPPVKNRSAVNKPEESTVPIYSIKYRSFIDMQDYVINNQREGRSNKPIPDEVILTIDLPLLRNSSTLSADVIEDGWGFELISDKSALYKLKLKLPFQVYNDAGKAIFDKDKRKLSITMKTVQKNVGFVFPEHDLGEQVETQDEIQRPPGVLRPSMSRSIDSANDLPLESMSLSDPSPSPPDDSSGHLLSSSVGSQGSKKSVSFSDVVQRQLYRSNSSILGQRKKNQRKAKNKKKSRERLNSGESISSMDDDNDGAGGTGRIPRQRICSGESVSSMDENDLDPEVLEDCSGEEE